MKLLIVVLLLCIAPTKLLAYRDGARENSCYDHAIVHEGAETFACVPAECPFFLRIREVVDEDTLELGNETVSAYQCGELYGIELANSLNDPEGFLVQARSGTDPSSKILGEFLNPDDVQMRNPAVPLNFKVLNCNQSMESGIPLPNSATHPRTVDGAGVLQLYWRAPNCSECGLGDLRIWFTAVQQLQIVFETSKSTMLQLQNYTSPDECITTAPPTTTMPSTTTAPPITTSENPTPTPTSFSVIGLAVGVAVGGVALIGLTIAFVMITSCLCVKASQSSDDKKPNRISRLWNVETPDDDKPTKEPDDIPLKTDLENTEQNGASV